MKSKETKQREALERSTEHDSLSTMQKITKLDLKFGQNKGAEKERRRLHVRMTLETTNPEQNLPKSAQDSKKKPYQKPKRS